jgi:hypothetical protein
MRRTLINLLAVIGGLTILSVLAAFVLRQYDGSTSIVVMGPDEKPAAGAPVFLDRGSAAIERYVTDSHGRFTFPLNEFERDRAKWLICAPGGIPMVGSPGHDGIQLGPKTYGYTRQEAGKGAFIRTNGWLGPVPRECPPPLDSVGWRYPKESGKDPRAFTLNEPDWNTYKR